ncbi:putative acyl-CoA oxidase [Streptomyces lincolnensis]|uniref:Putative acyl-CoA oxidase n=2 Tax=Streptomyces lincolnensis TaxID=1915 RepID=A0A1B1M1F5_STRLN|nr:putative acyl-CoA oxidase [Streptomyces lincolnensis]AXG51424.1 putative acyl-CoA oxidase [Streptomyces lincolnensis]
MAMIMMWRAERSATFPGVSTSQLPGLSAPLATPDALKRLLFDAQAETHELWRRLFSTPAFSFREGLTHEQRTELSYRRLRWLNAAIPDVRALIRDPVALSTLHEWAGVADAGMATIASIHYNLFLGSLLDHDQGGRDLGPYLRMEKIGVFLTTEKGHGNDATNLETTATLDRDAGQFVLTTPTPAATKWMPNTSLIGGPKDAVVAARLMIDNRDHGVFLFLTPLSDASGRHLPGVDVRPLPETVSAPVDHCATSFHDVRLPLTALLQGPHGRLSPTGEFSSDRGNARKRFLRSVGRVTPGKLCMSAYSLGTMRHAMAVAVAYAHQRHTSDLTGGGKRVPLWAHRTHHAPLVEGLATTYAATLLQRRVVQQWSDVEQAGGGDAERQDAERMTAIAKSWITWSAREVMTTCRERCGAQGLALANGIAGQLVANEGTITAEGDNLVVRLVAAAEMLMGASVPRPHSAVPPGDRSLADPEHLHDLLADLERIRYARARTRVRLPGAPSPLARWNRASAAATSRVEAHAYRLAAEALADTAARSDDPQARLVLHDLHRLFVLGYVSRHSGELLAHGRLTADQVLRLPDEIEAAVDAIAPHALMLTEAFDVPEEVRQRHPMLRSEVPETAVLV